MSPTPYTLEETPAATEAIELANKASARADLMQAQRDELLIALRDILMHSHAKPHRIASVAESAIAKCEAAMEPVEFECIGCDGKMIAREYSDENGSGPFCGPCLGKEVAS